jgi:4-diphosphocytidyl-2-C-methyl-D-erythritol kinase
LSHAFRLRALAPAKINLFLHVGAPEANGYHPLSSLVAFADFGDVVTIEPAEGFGLTVEGPFSVELRDEPDNLIARAARAFARAAGLDRVDVRVRLDKHLPIASGVGGGSADAGAALRLLRAALAPELADAALIEAAGGLGADGPMCLVSRPALASGYGERLEPAPLLPEICAVLVNPRAPSPTGPVYRAYDAAIAPGGAAPPDLPGEIADVAALAALLARTRNDLQAPAVALAPAIGAVLEALAAAPETLFARMSGSGATCFALCQDARAATALAARLVQAHAGWWIQPCRLGGPWPRQAPHEASLEALRNAPRQAAQAVHGEADAT